MKRNRRLSQKDLRALGATPGRVITRYSPDGERAELHTRLAAEHRTRALALLEEGARP
jgi:hypothetical protein